MPLSRYRLAARQYRDARVPHFTTIIHAADYRREYFGAYFGRCRLGQHAHLHR